MILTGFTDEAGQDLDTQIKATKELGWKHISLRMIDGVNVHDLPMDTFNSVAERLDSEGIRVIEFGSLIGNWGKSVHSDFAITIAEVERAIPRMQRMGTRLIRVMSYKQEPWGQDQCEEERFRRLREITSRFADAGLQAIHENCMNWGGFSPRHTLRLIAEVPGLRLVFDTGNPVFQRDRSKPEPYPWQDPMEFFEAVKDHVVHVHIKDCLNPAQGNSEPERYTFPGEGQAKVPEILAALKQGGYAGACAIEPHIATVFHATEEEDVDPMESYNSYVAYGKALETLLGH